ncbi:hypothetical protein V2H45_05185 [Tumidithrix elongata RA019]|uniref:Uncharacterized protein n=1 Tax=Tumidithrix elongata BACA0141 TaxID=2716417 RepID=A0AAW9Q0K6_9CYAN|nr:hypothetical protein [Tumidithrix elongata RA019]
MEDLNLLDEIVADLEQSENILRIKRLILFTSNDFWSNDAEEIKYLDLRQLIQTLLVNVPNIDHLKHKLNSQVKRLTKQADYLLAADTIIDTIGLLYSFMPKESHDRQQITQARVYQVASEPDTESNYQSSYEQVYAAPVKHKLAYIPNPFEIRLEISRNICPLHAKIVLFSALNYRFSPSEKDWSPLSTYDLNDLLDTIFQACQTVEELESKLYGTAKTLDQAEDGRRAAGVIIQALKPLYEWEG